jgi:DNA-binding MarR family transcriptional regulator
MAVKNVSPALAQGAPAVGGEGPLVRDIEVAGALRTVMTRLIKLLRRETKDEAQLSLTERSTMGLLYQHGELLPSDIARMEKVTTQSMSQIVNHLFEVGFINKNSSAEDKRKVLLSLTPAGRVSVEERRHNKEEWLAKALHGKASPEERELVMRALVVLEKLMDEKKEL